MSITYTVEKKKNPLKIHSVMETWKYTIIRNFFNFIILCLCLFFEIFAAPLTESQVRHYSTQIGKLKFQKKHAGNGDFVESKGLYHGSLKFLKDAFAPKKTIRLMVAQSLDQTEAVTVGVL